METIDYPTRKDLVEAIVDFRKRGIHAEVVHNGLTLSFPEGIPDADVEEPDPNEEHEAPADGIEKTPVEGDSLVGVVKPEDEPLDRSTFTVEGTCSACEQPALAEPDGSWIHAEVSEHGDGEGVFVPNEEESEDEDIIGISEPAETKASKRKRSR